mmetsp:Transcript_30813/g.87167  ORF Transcript_30813/g.87167 Transcript_30813/m.87167 type:complete len:118 (+) Transcript_30813:938-1291(+)
MGLCGESHLQLRHLLEDRAPCHELIQQPLQSTIEGAQHVGELPGGPVPRVVEEEPPSRLHHSRSIPYSSTANSPSPSVSRTEFLGVAAAVKRSAGTAFLPEAEGEGEGLLVLTSSPR